MGVSEINLQTLKRLGIVDKGSVTRKAFSDEPGEYVEGLNLSVPAVPGSQATGETGAPQAPISLL